jgi:hypothetical protein
LPKEVVSKLSLHLLMNCSKLLIMLSFFNEKISFKLNLKDFRLNSGPDRERILIRLLAGLAVVQGFERTYTLIWGSQIFALQFLNSAGSVNSDLLRPWYDQAAAREPDLYAVYSFDQWLGFLQVSLLVLRAGDTVSISLEGREFLKYLLHQGYSLYKGG